MHSIYVFLSHGKETGAIAEAIAQRLERGAEATVWVEACENDETVAEAWEGGTSSRAMILLLSPGAVPRASSREFWDPLLHRLESGGGPPIAFVLANNCAYPKLLERTRFFRWHGAPRDTLRALERWILTLHASSSDSNSDQKFQAAALPWWEGRCAELEALWDALVDGSGMAVLASNGKSSLAQEFARAAAGHFRETIWVGCRNRAAHSIMGELAWRLGCSPAGSEEELRARLERVIEEHRLLLILDGVTGESPVSASLKGRGSVLVVGMGGTLVHPQLVVPSAEEDLQMLRAIAVCRHDDCCVELAVRVAGMGNEEARDSISRLVGWRWLDPLDAVGSRFRFAAGRLAETLCEEHEEELFRRRHAEALVEIFNHSRTQLELCRQLLAELEISFDWAVEANWNLATILGRKAFYFLKDELRIAEACALYDRLRQEAVYRGASETVDECTYELSWVREEDYRIRNPLPATEQLSLF